MNELIEIPFLSATMLDSSFSIGPPAIRKYRQQFRRNLDPGIRFSVGRGGTVQLNTVAALDCVATAGRWKTRDAEHLESAYKSAGLTKLVQSKNYGDALNLVRDALQEEIRSKGKDFSRDNSAELIARCVGGLAITQPLLRGITLAMGSIMKKVDAQLHQMKRLPGHIVRHEGPEALIVVNTGEREELRSVQGAYLKSLGLQERGAPFVLHELSWSPDTIMSVFFPALDLERADGVSQELEDRLKAAEQPLPEPAELSAF